MDSATVIEIASTLGWTLLHFLWQGALIGIAYALARLWLRSDLARHHAALVGLALSLAVPLLTFHTLWMSVPAAINTMPLPAITMLNDGAVAVPMASASSAQVGLAWTAWLSALWLLGALLILVHLLRDWLRLRRVIGNSLPAPADLIAVLEREVERFGLRRQVRLRLTASYGTPGVYGIVRPVILMPVALLLKLPMDQIETLIAHELAHVHRLDALGNLLAIGTRTLLYFHPVVHWLTHDLERLRERLCDDLVLERRFDRINYARALSTVAQNQPMAPAALLTASGGELTARVHHILGMEEPATGQRNRLAPLLFALTTIAVSLLGLRNLSDSPAITAARPELQIIAGMLAPALLGPPEMTTAIAEPALPTLVAPLPAQPQQEHTVAVDGVGMRDMATATTSPLATTVVQRQSPYPMATSPVEEIVPAPADNSIPTAAPTAVNDPIPSQASITPTSVTAEPVVDTADGGLTTASTAEKMVLPQATRIVHPQYPTAAYRAELEGVVTLSFEIDRRGRTSGIEVVNSNPELAMLEATAIDALQQWRFEAPGPISGRYQQQFAFSLEGGSQGECVTQTGSRICRRLR